MRVLVLSSLIAAGLASVAWSQATVPVPAPAPSTLDPKNFTGGVTPKSLSDLRVARYTFDAGARTHWHSHEAGQVIVVESGRMRAQERGGTGREFAPRETYVVSPGVEHWHGALPGAPLTQVALSYGATRWMQPVTDAEYVAAGR
jgi:quercetin dioxygenase-like cupin family protein